VGPDVLIPSPVLHRAGTLHHPAVRTLSIPDDDRITKETSVGLFHRRPKQTAGAAPYVSADELSLVGRRLFGGESPHPPGFSRLTELDALAIRGIERHGHPTPGTAAWAAMEAGCLADLRMASHDDDWAVVGAFCVVCNTCADLPSQQPEFVRLMEDALDFMRRDGVAYAAVPPFAIRHWEGVHGTEGVRPAGWPSAFDTVPLPDDTWQPSMSVPLGEVRAVALGTVQGLSRSYLIENRGDAGFVVLIEGADPESGVDRRWEWHGVSAPTQVGILRELGDRLITPTDWAHEDLAPWFPCRARTRDDMRRLAAEAP
jgi:hypothetical protein